MQDHCRCGFQAIVLIARAQLRRKSPFQPPARHSPYRSRCSVLTPASTPGPLTPDLLVLIRFGDPDLVTTAARQPRRHRTTSQVFRFIFPGIRTIHEMKLLPCDAPAPTSNPRRSPLSLSFSPFLDLSPPGFHPSPSSPATANN
ncbi:hypothetical protein BJV77DRAFT_1073000 [Russula vinacea]|nr:hypothetical protein BJV77DRAFT_1073000 [Russula vinacea]